MNKLKIRFDGEGQAREQYFTESVVVVFFPRIFLAVRCVTCRAAFMTH